MAGWYEQCTSNHRRQHLPSRFLTCCGLTSSHRCCLQGGSRRTTSSSPRRSASWMSASCWPSRSLDSGLKQFSMCNLMATAASSVVQYPRRARLCSNCFGIVYWCFQSPSQHSVGFHSSHRLWLGGTFAGACSPYHQHRRHIAVLTTGAPGMHVVSRAVQSGQ
jgi:hypothetical protein